MLTKSTTVWQFSLVAYNSQSGIWHCNFILSHLVEDTSKFFPNVSLDLIYRTIKVLVAQHCSIANFETARDNLAWALDHMKKHRNMGELMYPDNISSQDEVKNMWVDDLQISMVRVHLLHGCPDECAEVIQDYLASSPEICATERKEVCEGALTLLTKAYLDMDDLITATKLIMVIKNVKQSSGHQRAH